MVHQDLDLVVQEIQVLQRSVLIDDHAILARPPAVRRTLQVVTHIDGERGREEVGDDDNVDFLRAALRDLHPVEPKDLGEQGVAILADVVIVGL